MQKHRVPPKVPRVTGTSGDRGYRWYWGKKEPLELLSLQWGRKEGEGRGRRTPLCAAWVWAITSWATDVIAQQADPTWALEEIWIRAVSSLVPL